MCSVDKTIVIDECNESPYKRPKLDIISINSRAVRDFFYNDLFDRNVLFIIF
jgi:hypothetical protein